MKTVVLASERPPLYNTNKELMSQIETIMISLNKNLCSFLLSFHFAL